MSWNSGENGVPSAVRSRVAVGIVMGTPNHNGTASALCAAGSLRPKGVKGAPARSCGRTAARGTDRQKRTAESRLLYVLTRSNRSAAISNTSSILMRPL